MSTLLENIKHLAPEAQIMVLNEAPQGWLVGDVPEPFASWLGSEKRYFLDLGFEDWPGAEKTGNVYLTAIAGEGLNIPDTGHLIRSPRTHELVIEQGITNLSLRDDWLTYVQLVDFHRKDDLIVWFGANIRADRRAGDFDDHPERFENDGQGWQRIS